MMQMQVTFDRRALNDLIFNYKPTLNQITPSKLLHKDLTHVISCAFFYPFPVPSFSSSELLVCNSSALVCILELLSKLNCSNKDTGSIH